MNLWTAWKMQPQTPFPTLDHHLFHVFLPFAIVAILIDAGWSWLKSVLVVWGVLILFEIVQMTFFNETTRNSFNDMVQFSFVWVFYLAHEGKTEKSWYWVAGGLAAMLLVSYVLLTTRTI